MGSGDGCGSGSGCSAEGRAGSPGSAAADRLPRLLRAWCSYIFLSLLLASYTISEVYYGPKRWVCMSGAVVSSQPSALMHPIVRTRKKSEEQPRHRFRDQNQSRDHCDPTKRLPTNPEIEARFENYVGICRTYGKMREFGKK